jgi:peroxiredoxin
MRPTESPVSEELGAPPAAPGTEPSPREEPPQSGKFSPRKILLLALAVILIVVFSGWLTERRITSPDDMIDGQLSMQPIGETAPNFKLKSTDGREIKLSDYHGRTVIVAFWASWCMPCLAEMPELVSFYQQQGGKVPLLAVSMDDTSDAAKDYADHNHLPFPVLFDAKEHVAAGYAVEGIPALFVVDPEGTIRAHHQGLISSLDTVLESDVQASQGSR